MVAKASLELCIRVKLLNKAHLFPFIILYLITQIRGESRDVEMLVLGLRITLYVQFVGRHYSSSLYLTRIMDWLENWTYDEYVYFLYMFWSCFRVDKFLLENVPVEFTNRNGRYRNV